MTFQCPENNAKAVQAAKAKNKMGTGGSDAHNPKHIGLTYTEFQGEITCEREFIAALKRGQFRAVTARKRVQKELARRRRSYRLPKRAEVLTPIHETPTIESYTSYRDWVDDWRSVN